MNLVMIQNLRLIAILCNSTVIEIDGYKIQVSQRFRGCQMLQYIEADSTNGDPNTLNDDITDFDGL